MLLPKGLWARHTLNDQTANALVPDALADLGGGACFNDARVQIELASGYARQQAGYLPFGPKRGNLGKALSPQ